MKAGLLISAAVLVLMVPARGDDEDEKKKAAKPAEPVTIKSLDDALEHIFSYRIVGTDVVDLGRDLATRYICRNLEPKRMGAAFAKLRTAGGAASGRYSTALGGKVDRALLREAEYRFRRSKDPALRRYRLIDYLARVQSLEETARRLELLRDTDPAMFKAYRSAIIRLRLILIPARIKFFFGTGTLEEVLKQFAGGRIKVRPVDESIWGESQTLDAGWIEREESVLIGQFELVPDADFDQAPLSNLNGKQLAAEVKRQVRVVTDGVVPDHLADIPDEMTWEQAARGPHNRRVNVVGDLPAVRHEDFNAWPTADDFVAFEGSRARPNPAHRPMKAIMKRWPKDRSAYGLIAMTGNAREFVRDRFRGLAPVVTGAPERQTPESKRRRWGSRLTYQYKKKPVRFELRHPRYREKGGFAHGVGERTMQHHKYYNPRHLDPLGWITAISRTGSTVFTHATNLDTSRVTLRWPAGMIESQPPEMRRR